MAEPQAPESELVVRQGEHIGAALAVVDSEVAFQLQGYNDPNGVSPTSLREVYPTYQRIVAEGSTRRRNAYERAIVRSVDTLWTITKGVQSGLITSNEEAARLSGAMLLDDHFPPNKALMYLRGDSPYLPEAITPNQLAGALELHATVNDEVLNDDIKVSVPAIVKIAERAGLELSAEALAMDDTAVNIVTANIKKFEIVRHVGRASAEGDPYVTTHRVAVNGIIAMRENGITPLDKDEMSDPLMTPGSLGAYLEQDDPTNAADLLLHITDTETYGGNNGASLQYHA